MSATRNNLDRLTRLPRALLAAGYGEIPEYRTLRDHAVSGRFAARQINQIWHFEKSKVRVIADALGLVRAEEHEAA